MKKYIISGLLILSFLFLSACSSQTTNWYKQKEVTYLGLSKKEVLTSLNIPKTDYSSTNFDCTVELLKPVTIDGYNYKVTLLFNSNGNGNPLKEVYYTYEADRSSANAAFDETKKLANILTKKFGEPITDISYYEDIFKPYLSSVNAFDDLSKKKTEDDSSCFDLWTMDRKVNKTECKLEFTYNKSKVNIIAHFIKYDIVDD